MGQEADRSSRQPGAWPGAGHAESHLAGQSRLRTEPHTPPCARHTQAEPCQLDEGARCLARCLAVDTLAVHEQWPEVLEACEELGAP